MHCVSPTTHVHGSRRRQFARVVVVAAAAVGPACGGVRPVAKAAPRSRVVTIGILIERICRMKLQFRRDMIIMTTKRKREKGEREIPGHFA